MLGPCTLAMHPRALAVMRASMHVSLGNAHVEPGLACYYRAWFLPGMSLFVGFVPMD